MSNSRNFQVIVWEWRVLANELCCSETVKLTIDTNIKYEGWTATPIIQELLSCFRRRFSREATLQRFIEVLEKCSLNDIANELRKEFSSNIDIQKKVEDQMQTKKYSPINPEHQTADTTSVHDSWDSRKFTLNENSVVSLVKQPQTVKH